MEAKRKRGRPKIENPMCEQVNVRLNKSDMKALEDFAKTSGKDKSDVIRFAIKLVVENDKGGL